MSFIELRVEYVAVKQLIAKASIKVVDKESVPNFPELLSRLGPLLNGG